MAFNELDNAHAYTLYVETQHPNEFLMVAHINDDTDIWDSSQRIAWDLKDVYAKEHPGKRILLLQGTLSKDAPTRIINPVKNVDLIAYGQWSSCLWQHPSTLQKA